MGRPGRPLEKKNSNDNNDNEVLLFEFQSNTAVVK